MHAPSFSTSTLLLCLSLAACQAHAQPMRRQNEEVNIPGEVKIPEGVSIDDVNFDTLVALATSIGIDGSVVTSLAGEVPTGILNTATATTATSTNVLPTTTTTGLPTETTDSEWDLFPTSTDSTSTGNPKSTNSRTSTSSGTGTTSTSTSSASTSTSTADNDNGAMGKVAMSSSLLVGFTAVLGGVLAGIVVTL